MNKECNFSIIETFVGCGGSYIGFKNNDFRTIFVNDFWEDSLKTLRYNNKELSDEQVINCDISELVDRDLCTEFNIKKGELSVLMGGVVCKGFSLAGVRNPFDSRNYLYISQLKLVEQLKPKISIIENVPGMRTMRILAKPSLGPISKKFNICLDDKVEDLCKEIDGIITQLKNNTGKIISINKKINSEGETYENNQIKEQLLSEKEDLIQKRDVLNITLEKYKYNVIEDIIGKYNELGYSVHMKQLICTNYGGYTSRQRLIIVAIRNDLDNEWEWPEITHNDENDKLLNFQTVKDAFNLLDYKLTNNPENDSDNIPMNHKESTIEKFKSILEGTKNNGFSSRGSSNRLVYSKPAPTLVPGHSSFQIHPSEHRSITVREGAVITGFPIDYKFFGSHSSRCIQIGNAIPFHLSNAIAKSAKKFLSKFN